MSLICAIRSIGYRHALIIAALASILTAPTPVDAQTLASEVATLIARGLTNRQIAEELVVTERTVAAHVEHILNKLDFASRTQIGVWAAEQRLLQAREGSSA